MALARVYVIGVGYRGLDERARDILLNAEVILSSKRLYEVFMRYPEYERVAPRIIVHERFTEMMQYLRQKLERDQDVVLLGSGDPLFFGIGRRLLREFGPEKVEILPDLSSMQVAMARAGIPWDDAFFMSLHGGPIEGQRRHLPYGLEHIPSLLKRHKKVVVLTDSEYNPKRIAQSLSNRVPFRLAFYVCQKMGYPDEKVEKLTLEEAEKRDFQEPNLVILVKEDEDTVECIFGLKEEEIEHKRSLITKDEIRAVCIHKLRLPHEGVLWDIGAGSGSVSIESARVSPFLRVFAIEKDNEMIEMLWKNRDRLGTPNIEIINTEAPEGLEELPPPDRVFIGGSGGRLKEIVERVSGAMKEGIVVINLSRLELIREAMELLKTQGYRIDISHVSVSRGADLAGLTYLRALNPVFILRGQK